jgi:protein-S-isoprenylcysteine O-methyltransferase
MVSMAEYFLSPVRLSSSLGVGVVTSLVGLIIRGSAILTAGSGFTHLITRNKSPQHKLITTAIYRYMRHPGYCGWLIWVMGSQLILDNPVSLVAFSLVTWKFFKERIPYEEGLLEKFFGNQYIEYRNTVRFSGVPGIS